MEYENMRMPELKSLAIDRRLRNYSQMRKAELVALLQNSGTPEGPRTTVPTLDPFPITKRGPQGLITSTEARKGPGFAPSACDS